MEKILASNRNNFLFLIFDYNDFHRDLKIDRCEYFINRLNLFYSLFNEFSVVFRNNIYNIREICKLLPIFFSRLTNVKFGLIKLIEFVEGMADSKRIRIFPRFAVNWRGWKAIYWRGRIFGIRWGRWEEEWWRQERKRNVTRSSSLLVVCYEEKEHSSTFEWLVFRSGKGVLEGRYDERKEQNRPRKSSNNAEDFNETSARRETIPNFYARGATKTKKREEKNKPKPGPTQLLPILQLCERPAEKFPPRIWN